MHRFHVWHALALLGALLCSLPASAQAQWSMGFLESAQDPTQRALVNYSAVTHIMDFGVHPVSDGTLTCDFGSEACSSSAFTTARASLISTAHSRGVKVLMCVTDANGAGGFAGAASSGTLSTFVANIMTMVNTNGYDGVDLDWEASSYTTLMPGLISALRTALGSTRLLAVDAIPGTQGFWATNFSNMDRINFMTYDQEGNFNPYTWFNAALFSDPGDGEWSLDLMKRRAIAAGIPAGKINLGIPFYGYLQTGGPTGPRQSVAGNPPLSQLRYSSIVSTYPSQSANPTIDSVSQTPWFAASGGWVEYDNPASVTAKANYIKTNNLGGWILFSLNKDATGQPLAAAVAAVLGATPPPTISSFTATPATIAPGASSSLAWVESGGTTCSISGIGTVPCSPSSRVVTPAATTTYTLTVTNSAGSVTRNATVTVTPAQTACVNGAGDAAFIQGLVNAAAANSTVTLTGTCQLGSNSVSVPSKGLTLTGTATLTGNGGASSNYNLDLGSNTTLTALTFNNATVGTVGASSSITTNLTISGVHFQNLTSHATAQVSFGPVLTNSSLNNCSFFNIWPGGYTSTTSNPTETLGSGNTAVNGFNGYDRVTISGNTFDEIYNDGIHLGFNQMLALTSTYPLAHGNVVSNNTFTRVHRYPIEVQSTPDGNCQGGCHFIAPQDGMVISGNYAHNPAWPYWNQWYSLVPDHSTNSQWVNNAWIYDNTSQACSGFLVDFWEMSSDNLLFQGNVGAALPVAVCTNRQHYNTLASSNTSSTTTLQNNVLCGPAVNPNSVGIENSGAAPILVNQFNYRNAASCPAGSALATSSITAAFTSANNQAFPSGGNGTWSNSVISNLPIRQVQYFIDGSSTAAVSQQVQDVSTTFAADRQWLYHATISTTGMAAGNHTITATATDVSGATQSVSQGFTVGSLVRSRGPEPSLPFARIPAGHAECEFGMILDTLLSNWNQNCLTTEIKNVNTYLTAGKSTSQSFTLFPQSVLQQYNVKLTQNGVSGQSGIVGFGGDDIGANLGDPGFRSYVFDTYIPTILMPHAPNQTPVYVSIDNYLNPGRSWFGVTTNGSWSNSGVTWDPPFAQTDPAWNLLVAGWYQYATIHAPNIRLDPHLGSMAVSDWAAFPTLFQYTPSLMREWFNISGLHGYSASVRQQNYLGLYWFEQFGNHFAPVFPADGTTRTFHWGVQPDNGDYHSAFANYLMVRGPNTFFDIIETVNGLATGVDPNRWLPIAKALGTATSDIINAVVAPGHVAGDGYSLMERTWTNGIAYDNMTGVTQTVALPAGSLAWVCTATPPCTFTPVSSLTLPDGIGDVILLSAPTGVPVITSFTSNPAQVNLGSSSTLSWSTTGATSLTLNPGNINVTGLTSSVVTPSSTTTYTLTATNSLGSIQSTLTVTVRLPASYFVSSSTGVDTNPGTQAAPWKTISKASAGPAGGYIPADSVLLKAGDTWCQTGGTCAFPGTFTANFTTPSSGTSGNPITYGTYGTGAAPILDGSGGFGVIISRNFITWNGIQIKNIAGTGILFSNTTGTQIRNVTATNVNNWAFKGYQVGTSTLDGNTCTSTSGFVQLSGCIIAQVNGATPHTQTITATHNTCHFDFLNTASSGGNVICVEIGGPVATNSSIVGNLSFGGTQFGGFKPGSCTGAGTADVCFGQVTGGLIADNEIHKAIFFGTPGSTTLVGDGETIELQGAATAIQTGVVVTRNVIYGQQSVGGVTGGTNVAGNTNDLIGLFQAQGNSIYGNVLVCPCGNEYAIQFETNAGGNSVFNNTIIQAPLNLAISNIPTQMAIRIGTDSNETIKNNIISGFAQGITGNSSNISDYNLFDSTVTSPVVGGILAGTNSLIGPTPASVFATTPAVLQNDVKLIAGSLAASAGLNLGVAFSQILDPSGAVVPYSIFTQTTSWEMGAFGTTLLAPARTVINGAVINGAVIQ